jgi:uncharacterized protein YbjT (DUF2867 family)
MDMDLSFQTMARLSRAGLHGPMTQVSQDQALTLVLGGTGKTGSRVARRLHEFGRPIRIGSRSGAPPFSWEDDATWQPVLRGVDTVYLTYYPDAGFAAAAESIGSFAKLAVASGARRLVALTGRGESGALRSEQAIIDSGADWTIVRASFFAQNFSESFVLDAVRAGFVAMPTGGVAEPFIDAEDIADIATAALTEPGHAGEVYEVTGPESITFADAVARIAAAVGREIGYLDVSPAEYRSAMIADGVPTDFASELTEVFVEVLDGRNVAATDGVRRVLGREAGRFGDYVRRTAATGVWDVEPTRSGR